MTVVAAILASSVVFLDGSVVNVALPALRDDLNAGLATQQWVVEAYLLTLSALILAGGSYADIRGRKHALMVGVTGFAAASLVCAIAPSALLLVLARALQGVAGALLVPASLAVITAAFDDPAERGAAVGTWTAYTGIAFVVGPLAGGFLVDAVSWRLVFAINIPIAVLTLWLAQRHIQETKDPDAAGSVDLPAVLLSCIFLGGTVLALIRQPQLGWGDPQVWGSLVASLAAFVAFIQRERRCPHPMLPLELFRNRNFSAVNAATLTIYGGLSAFTFFAVIYLQQVGGYSAIEAGMALMPVTVIMFLLSRRFGELSMRIGPRLLMTIGPLLGGAGLFLLRGVDTRPDYASEVLPGVIVFSIGLSMTVAPLTATVLSSVDQRYAGVASGVNNAVARVAGLVAIAVVGAVVASSFTGDIQGRMPRAAVDQAKDQPLVTVVPDGVPRGQRATAQAVLERSSVDAFRTGMTLSALLVAAGGLISAAGVRNPKVRAASPRPSEARA
jgi:EmrB/QacA subfamily drug resistance transporter